ncbi:NADH:ubiquinone reductase (Na(+)-transporting) subunit A [PVC group bacterium (ex Bugula neritina AB1)]|nr:NADH:ubiquinone reductase (Na(+)-transporting) subunit A [PVC group bacterium (ex Bugula neritina AB1)]
MSYFVIKKGKNIKVKGSPSATIDDRGYPASLAIHPEDFKGIKPRLLVKVGQTIKKGDPLFEDKNGTATVIVAPLGGSIKAINRGEKRVLINVVIDVNPDAEEVRSEILSAESSRKDWVDALQKSGLWAFIRQRPFSKILDPQVEPKSIFVKALNTEPLALDLGIVVEGKRDLFQAGLDVLNKLTDGKVHLCYAADTESKVLRKSEGVEHHTFAGPHPAGNISTFVSQIDPLRKKEVIAYIDAQDVLRLGFFAKEGRFYSNKVIALTGEGVVEEKRRYIGTHIGVSISDIVKDGETSLQKEDLLYISGSVLNGSNIEENGFVRYYHSQVHLLPDKPQRKLLRFFRLGLGEYTFSKAYLGGFLPRNDVSLDSSINGSDRAIVMNDVYDQYISLDIYTYFLIKAILAEQWDEAESLGLLECDPEDFALASFACPSKTDVMGIIAHGLDSIEKEG